MSSTMHGETLIKSRVNFTLEQATKTQKGSRGIALLFLNLGARCGCVVNAIPRPFYPRERNTVLIVQEAGWAPGPAWTGAENLAPHRDSISGPSSHLKIFGARRVTRGKFHTKNPQIFRRHTMKLSLQPCTPLPDGSPSQHVPHTYHTVLQKRFALVFKHRRPETWLDMLGYINSYNYKEPRL